MKTSYRAFGALGRLIRLTISNAAVFGILVLGGESKAQTPISFGQTKIDQQLVVAQNTVFSFPGTVGELVTIQMSIVSGDFVPTFDLLSPTGNVLKTVTDPSNVRSARLALFALPASGTYLLICRDSTGRGAGGYNLSFTGLTGIGDEDNDGLPDSWERQYFGDLRYGPDDDPDGDGLKNSDEFARKTDPTKADTDGDGFKDGTEVALGSDPLDANSRPSTELRIFVKTVDIEFLILAGQRYQLQASHDFKNWVNLGDAIQGDNSLFRTNIEVRGTDYKFFIAPSTAVP